MNLARFLAMGGYAAYVWPSFGLVVMLLIYNVRAARRYHANARAQALHRANAPRKGA